MKNQKQEMQKAVAATVMFLDTLFSEATQKEEKQETTEEKSFNLFCNNKKQRAMLKTGY